MSTSPFAPYFSISTSCAKHLMRIEVASSRMEGLPVTPQLLHSLRQTAQVNATHFSTLIEGNRLTQKEVEQVILKQLSITGKVRDEKEVRGYYAALLEIERYLGYYAKLDTGPSHNYYLGRKDVDLTDWVEYFCKGMAEACTTVAQRALELSSKEIADDASALLRRLLPRKRRALELFVESDYITSKDIRELFGVKPSTARLICKQWTDDGFLVIVDPSKRARRYELHAKYQRLVKRA